MILSSQEQLKAEMLRDRVVFNKVLVVLTIVLICSELILLLIALIGRVYFLFVPFGILIFTYFVPVLAINAKIRRKEEVVAVQKLRKTVDDIVIKDEYELPVMDSDATVKVSKQGFNIDGEVFGYDNFDIFLGTTNLYRQVSLAVFVVSNYSPFADDKTYPINFGIVLDSEALGCAKQYFFEKDYKAFNFILENPEQSAKEILRYGMLKIQIEEEKKQNSLDKLAKEMMDYEE